MDFSRDVLYRSFGCKSNHILCSGPMCRPPQYQDGRARRSPTTNRSKLAINSFSYSHTYYISNINSNKRSSPLASYSIYFLFFFPIGALRLVPRWRRRPLVWRCGTCSISNTRYRPNLGGWIKNGLIKFKPPFSAIRLGEWSEGRNIAKVSYYLVVRLPKLAFVLTFR